MNSLKTRMRALLAHNHTSNGHPAVAATKLPRLRGWFRPYRLFVRPWLFRLDAEVAHHFFLALGRFLFGVPGGKRLVQNIYGRKAPLLPLDVAGIDFRNPIGLAAGFDKNALLLPGVESLGFGFVEIGTVTPRPQLGNPPPRLSRVPEKRAIVNRMGFNNDGAAVISVHLKKVRDRLAIPVGVNLGKNRDTPNSEAIKDYESLFKSFHLTASYFVINISSPNTPGLRDLQSGEFIQKLGERILHLRVPQPVFIKLSPDIAHEDLKTIASFCGQGKPYAGLILTNTIPTDAGGISGYPLKEPSRQLLKVARTLVAPEVPIISVGGIETVEDVVDRLELGANAVQIYSSLVYQGPGLPSRLARELHDYMQKQGMKSFAEFREAHLKR